MHLLFFAPQPNALHLENLFADIHNDLPGKMHYFSDLEKMIAWLKIPPRRFSTALLLLTDCQMLIELVRLREFFHDRKVILSLPRKDRDSITLAHRMRPVYIASDPEERKNIGPILKKLSENGW